MLYFNNPQSRFINSTKKYRAFVGGFRSGKTFVGCARHLILASEHPNIKLGYFAPTYQQIGDIFYPSIEEVAAKYSDLIRCSVKIKQHMTKKQLSIFIGGAYYATIKCRSMDKPETIIGFDLNHAMIDEIDTMPIKKANKSWNNIIARLSAVHETYKTNTADFTTTPEGFGWIYDLFVKRLNAEPKLKSIYEIIKAPTTQNRLNLPSDYIQSLYDTYTPNLVKAYVNGEFTNLESGSVYHGFDRFLNDSYEEIKAGEALYIGMDFNVQNMSAVIHVKRGREAHAVAEISGALDTPAMLATIRERYAGHHITVYPDSSGDGRSTSDASKTDISQIKDYGYSVKAKPSNPRIKDRVNSLSAMICNGSGERKYFINSRLCPISTENLEQQVYDKSGNPDKAGGKDHTNDGIGYFIAHDYPIKKPIQKINLRSAI